MESGSSGFTASSGSLQSPQSGGSSESRSSSLVSESDMPKIYKKGLSEQAAKSTLTTITAADKDTSEVLDDTCVEVSKKEEAAHDKSSLTPAVGNKLGSSLNFITREAKKLILEHGLDVRSLKASVAHGKLLKGDVIAAVNARKSCSAALGASTTPVSESFERWVAPPAGIVKVNIDARWTYNRNSAIAAIARDCLGSLIEIDYKYTFHTSPADEERRAAVLGINLASRLGSDSFVLETTSSCLITYVHKQEGLIDGVDFKVVEWSLVGKWYMLLGQFLMIVCHLIQGKCLKISQVLCLCYSADWSSQ